MGISLRLLAPHICGRKSSRTPRCRAATKWYFLGGQNDVTCCCTTQIHTFVKISGGSSCWLVPLWWIARSTSS